MAPKFGRAVLVLAILAGVVGCTPEAKKEEANTPTPKTETFKTKDGQEGTITSIKE